METSLCSILNFSRATFLTSKEGKPYAICEGSLASKDLFFPTKLLFFGETTQKLDELMKQCEGRKGALVSVIAYNIKFHKDHIELFVSDLAEAKGSKQVVRKRWCSLERLDQLRTETSLSVSGVFRTSEKKGDDTWENTYVDFVCNKETQAYQDLSSMEMKAKFNITEATIYLKSYYSTKNSCDVVVPVLSIKSVERVENKPS